MTNSTNSNEVQRLTNLLKLANEENEYLKTRLNLSFSKKKRISLDRMTKRTRNDNLRKIQKKQGDFFNECIRYLGKNKFKTLLILI